MEAAVADDPDPTDRYASATTWLPVVVSVLLIAIVAVFIFSAPNQIVTPKDSGYLIASIPLDQDTLDKTVMR